MTDLDTTLDRLWKLDRPPRVGERIYTAGPDHVTLEAATITEVRPIEDCDHGAPGYLVVAKLDARDFWIEARFFAAMRFPENDPRRVQHREEMVVAMKRLLERERL